MSISMNDYSRVIRSIGLGVLSDSDILKKSVATIYKTTLNEESGTVYDPALGCTSNNSRCQTCDGTIFTCPGHFGHIDLNVPVIIFYRQVTALLKCVCLTCHRLLCTVDELMLNGLVNSKGRNVVGYSALVDYVGNQSMCAHCSNEQPTIRLKDNVITATYVKQKQKASVELTPAVIKIVFDSMQISDVKLLGVDVDRFHPSNFVLSKFPVLPITCRPKMEISTSVSDDDLSLLLVDIVRNNNNIEKNSDNEGNEKKREAYIKAVANVKTKTLAYCDNSKGIAVHNTNHKPMTGIKDRLTTKHGLIRQNINGKRLEKTARTVVGPDSSLELDQVAVPVQIARSLTIVERVNAHNYDQLTRDVNNGDAKFVIKYNTKSKIDVARARIRRGTIVQHGDIVERGDEKIVVVDCKMNLIDGDIVVDRSTGERVAVTHSSAKFIKLDIGDKVERYLKDGDPVLLNRQPTLHKNNIIGMRILVEPAKTVRVPLALTPGFNMDFDGDEGNLFLMDSELSKAEILQLACPANNLMSMQTSKPNIFLVQDSLLGAYLMTNERRIVKRETFYDCLLKTSALDRYPDVESRRREAIRLRIKTSSTKNTKNGTERNEKTDCENDYVSWQLFAFIMPDDFIYEWDNGLKIVNGVVAAGSLDKKSLKNSPNSIVSLLCSLYDRKTACRFVQDVQFLTCAWLETNNFSIGIGDCLISNVDKRHVKDITKKYFVEADRVSASTDNRDIREYRVQMELNKAKDLGSTIAKKAFVERDNNFVTMIESGSKGDYFNIVQITGLLGQQNVAGKRPAKQLNGSSRSMVHDSFLVTESKEKYAQRGFVSSSFIEGLDFREMFYHSMSGRDGMINTAMATAISGYHQRQLVKLLEDMRVAYDGSVRGANGNVYEYVYGNHGYDPSQIFRFNERYQVPELIDFDSLTDIISTKYPSIKRRNLKQIEIDDIIDGCRWYPRDSRALIPRLVYESVWNKYDRFFRDVLSRLTIADNFSAIDRFVEIVKQKYVSCRISAGENVGIIAAQSIGERQTQTNLDTFHTAGKLQEKKIGRLEEISTLSKTVRNKCNSVLKTRVKYLSAQDLRRDIGCSLVGVKLKSIVAKTEQLAGDYRRFIFEDKLCFKNRLDSVTIARALNEKFFDSKDSKNETFYEDRIDDRIVADSSRSIIVPNFSAIDTKNFNETYVCGIPSITAAYLDYNDEDGWYVVTEGCDYATLLSHHLFDPKRVYTNDFWQVYETLGIAAFKEYLVSEFKSLLPGIYSCHYRLIANRMTNLGKPTSITRYTMRDSDVGPLSKATFEECVDVMINAAVKTETEHNRGISAALMCANRPKCGTGSFDLKVNFESLLCN